MVYRLYQGGVFQAILKKKAFNMKSLCTKQVSSNIKDAFLQPTINSYRLLNSFRIQKHLRFLKVFSPGSANGSLKCTQILGNCTLVYKHSHGRPHVFLVHTIKMIFFLHVYVSLIARKTQHSNRRFSPMYFLVEPLRNT